MSDIDVRMHMAETDRMGVEDALSSVHEEIQKVESAPDSKEKFERLNDLYSRKEELDDHLMVVSATIDDLQVELDNE